MPTPLKLVWVNPQPLPVNTPNPLMLRMLGEVLAGSLRSGHLAGARLIASLHPLTPLAEHIVTRQMSRYGVDDDDIRKVM